MIGTAIFAAQVMAGIAQAQARATADKELLQRQKEQVEGYASAPVYRCAWCGLRGAFNRVKCEGCGAPT